MNDIYLQSSFNQYIEIDYLRCINGTSSYVCASTEVIDQTLYGSVCKTYYSAWAIDPNNYDAPMEKVVKNNWSPLLKQYSKTLSLLLIEVLFSSDDGWLTTSERKIEVLNPDSLYIDMNEIAPSIVFFTAIVQMGGNTMVYKRHYDKIQDVLARVSGTMGIIMIVLGILAIPYARTKMFEPLVNEIFDIKIEDNINLRSKISRPWKR